MTDPGLVDSIVRSELRRLEAFRDDWEDDGYQETWTSWPALLPGCDQAITDRLRQLGFDAIVFYSEQYKTVVIRIPRPGCSPAIQATLLVRPDIEAKYARESIGASSR